jgi:hypothetical protein
MTPNYFLFNIFSLGHVYTATGDYANALASHKQCVELIRSQLEDKLMVRSMKYTKENKKELKSLFAHYVFHLFEVTKKFDTFLPLFLPLQTIIHFFRFICCPYVQ